VHYTEQAGRLGGGVWSSVTADTQRGEIIATSGNPCSTHESDVEQDAIIGINWNTGKTNWKYTALESDTCDCDFGGGAVSYTYNGKDYIVAGNKHGTIYALVRQGNGVKLAWTRRVAQLDSPHKGGIYEPPSYKDGMVYFGPGLGVDNSCPSVWALKADNGDVVWRVCLDYRLISPAAITGDLIFVAERGKMLALELKTGRVVWQVSQPGDVWGGVAISRGFVVIGSVLHVLYCYSLPGT
jgi:outer membrane protein assembly factor BamB